MLTITELANTPVCIEDDAFDEETFFNLQVYASTFNNLNGFNYIRKDHKFYEAINKVATTKIYNHRIILRDRVPNKIVNLSDNLDESDFQYFIRNMETPETHKIHRDSGWKMLSTILYLSDDGDGTMFFDSELGTNLEEVEWRPNRLVSFIPSSTSWHSFKNSGQITRSTIQFTLYNKEYSKDEGNLDE